MLDELKKLQALSIIGPRYFKWWGNSCHYHTFLQVQVTRNIDYDSVHLAPCMCVSYRPQFSP